jgi:hypothetical protein
MCGLTLSIHLVGDDVQSSPPTDTEIFNSLCEACAARGPDAQQTWSGTFQIRGGRQVEVTLYSSVLGLRGGVHSQPIVGPRGVLGWNGQVGRYTSFTSWDAEMFDRYLAVWIWVWRIMILTGSFKRWKVGTIVCAHWVHWRARKLIDFFPV